MDAMMRVSRRSLSFWNNLTCEVTTHDQGLNEDEMLNDAYILAGVRLTNIVYVTTMCTSGIVWLGRIGSASHAPMLVHILYEEVKHAQHPRPPQKIQLHFSPLRDVLLCVLFPAEELGHSQDAHHYRELK